MKRLLACLALVTLFILSFPAGFSQESRNITGFSSVAKAGRSVPSMSWCQCGTQNCLCDTGEEPCASCPNHGLTMQYSPESEPPEVDAGAALTLLGTALLLVLRLRQMQI
ncbi:MAG TPA: hypothetical protein VNH22_07415 [Blastocatellia bacterium]|jgi:hypothetical protein|nr:hypothetical protein [Blastocatellia bacterium]